MVACVVAASGVLQQYYTTKLHELCDVMEQLHEQQQQQEDNSGTAWGCALGEWRGRELDNQIPG